MNWRSAPRPPERCPAGSVLVQARSVGVELGGRAVVSDLDLEVRAGELVALVGPNGAGKSTVLSMLSGDRAAGTGVVEIDRAPLGAWSDVELAMRRAVLPQQSTVSFRFQVRDVVAMGRAPWSSNATREEDRSAIDRAISEAGIGHLLHRSFSELSGGEQARVSLARVLAQDTQVLLLDEPTAALDLAHQEHVLGAVRNRVDDGAAGLLVVHDLELAGAYADRVVLLQEGRVVADGAPAEVLTAERLSLVYGHPVEVVEHPRSASPVILPVRAHGSCPALTPDGRIDRRIAGSASTPEPPATPLNTPDPITEPLDAS